MSDPGQRVARVTIQFLDEDHPPIEQLLAYRPSPEAGASAPGDSHEPDAAESLDDGLDQPPLHDRLTASSPAYAQSVPVHQLLHQVLAEDGSASKESSAAEVRAPKKMIYVG